jgi:hypothetical protein
MELRLKRRRGVGGKCPSRHRAPLPGTADIGTHNDSCYRFKCSIYCSRKAPLLYIDPVSFGRLRDLRVVSFQFLKNALATMTAENSSGLHVNILQF